MSIFRNSFIPEIKGQLISRGNAIKNRTPSGLQFFNGRNAWAKLTSGVDVSGSLSNGQDTALANVLYGGTANLDTNKNVSSLKVGLGTSNQFGAYDNQILDTKQNLIKYQRGIRPMAGITSISVESKSAYGSLREVTVNFVCHDIKQLEVLELLYMRPGFIVLLEWGWAPYLDNDGKIKSNIDFYKDIWDQNSSKTLQQRFSDLFNKSKTYFGNYDAVLGYVENYEWSARMDGGFDCKTEIVSVGEILESIKINYVPVYLPSIANGLLLSKSGFQFKTYAQDAASKPIKNFYLKNILAGLISELIFYGYVRTNGEKDKNSVGYAWQIKDTDGKITGTKDYILDFYQVLLNLKNNSTSKELSDNKIDDGRQVYLDLESFVKIIDTHVNLKDTKTGESLVGLSLTDREYDSLINTDKGLLCLSHPLQISVDPTICLIKNENYSNLDKIKFKADSLQAVYDPNDPNMAIRTEAYKTIKLYDDFSSEDHTNETAVLKILNTYYDANMRKYGFTKLSQYLADAFELYKNLNLKITRTNVSLIYDIGSELIIGKAINNTRFQQQKDEAQQKVINRTFNETIIDDLHTNEKDPSSLKQFFKRFGITGDPIQLANRFFIPDQNIHNRASENLSSVIVAEENNDTTKITSEKSSKNLLFLTELKREFFDPSTNKKFGRIGSIYINLGYALGLACNIQLENADNKEKKEINLYDFLKALLKGTQESIGSINHFDIHIDPVDNIARVIDVHYIDREVSQNAFNNSFMFLSPDNNNLDGNFNNIRNYKMTSQIFNEQATIVAISAQNGGGEIGLDNKTLVGWNKGIKDRIIPEKGVPQQGISYVRNRVELAKNVFQNISIIEDYINNLEWGKRLAYKSFTTVDHVGVYLSDEAERYKSALRDLLLNFIGLTNADAGFKSFIPTKLSLEIDGIGGLVIGHIFRIPDDLIPLGYKFSNLIGRRLGYVIIGIGHEITNDWVTKIDAYPIILEEPDGISLDLVKEMSTKNNNEIDINLDNSVAPTNVTKKPTGTDEQDIIKVINFLRENGFSNNAIAGITGNLIHESSLIPTAFNPAGGGMGAYGIAQWRGSRQLALKKNSNYDTLNVQLNFLNGEISVPTRSALEVSPSPATAAVVFERTFERSGGSGLQDRISIANYIFNKYLQ